MEAKILDLGAINGQISVQIVRKNIKNIHLKVFRSLEVVLSVPMNITTEWIDSFLEGHVEWIDGQCDAAGNDLGRAGAIARSQ